MLYPEQNEARLKLSLDGTWAFALGSCVEDQFDPAKPLPDAQPIAVPASYNDQNDQTTALRTPPPPPPPPATTAGHGISAKLPCPLSAPGSGWCCGSAR